jgi:hypothetical protein
MTIAIRRRVLLAAVAALICASAASAAQNTGQGPDGVTVQDLVDRGFICKPFGDGMLHCFNPDNSIPDWVCYPNEMCTPGKPRRLPGKERQPMRAPLTQLLRP